MRPPPKALEDPEVRSMTIKILIIIFGIATLIMVGVPLLCLLSTFFLF